jgi:phosphorylase kinase gamma subunit
VRSNIVNVFSGIASTVRKCIEKGSGKVFAVKMVDISTEHQTHEQAQRLREETLNEVALLKKLSSHLAISQLQFNINH